MPAVKVQFWTIPFICGKIWRETTDSSLNSYFCIFGLLVYRIALLTLETEGQYALCPYMDKDCTGEIYISFVCAMIIPTIIT